MLAAVLLIGGCSPGKHLAKTQQQQDSTRVEVRKEVVYVKDTVLLEIPSQTAEQMRQMILASQYDLPHYIRMEDGVSWLHVDTKPRDYKGDKVYLFSA